MINPLDPPSYVPPSYVPAAYLVTGSLLTTPQLVSQFQDFRDSLKYVSTAPELVFERLVANLNEACNAALELERQQHATALHTLQLSNEQLKKELLELKGVAVNEQEPEQALKTLGPSPTYRTSSFPNFFRTPGFMSLYSSPKTSSDLETANIVTKEKLQKNPRIGKFHTDELRSWREPRVETWKVVPFASKYPAPPGMPIGLTEVDIDCNDNPRVRAYANNIQGDRCEIHIDTWEATTLYKAGCTWLEIEANDPDFQYGSYNTIEDHPWYRPQMCNSRKITFRREYPSPPIVVVYLTGLDMKRRRHWRLKTYATDITATGFTIHIDTWEDSVLYSGIASWVAYPVGREGVYSGTFGTTDFRTWRNPQLYNSKYEKFGRGVFSATPRVMLALNWIDIDHGRNLRINVKASDISASGMTWHLDGWADTILYGARGSYIALS